MLPDICCLHIVNPHLFKIALHEFFAKAMMCSAFLYLVDHGVPEPLVGRLILLVILMSDFPKLNRTGRNWQEMEMCQRDRHLVSSHLRNVRELYIFYEFPHRPPVSSYINIESEKGTLWDTATVSNIQNCRRRIASIMHIKVFWVI